MPAADNMPRGDGRAHWLAGAAGLLTYLIVVAAGGTPVAWSATAYYWLGWPLMCAAIAGITWWYPQRSWRWPLSMMLGQVFASILYGNGAMIPVAVIFVTVLSLPQFGTAVWVSGRRLPAAPDAAASLTSGDPDQHAADRQQDGSSDKQP